MNILGFDIPYIPSFGGLAVTIGIILLIAFFAVGKNNGFAVLFGQMYEGMEDFFADILGEGEARWIKSFITNMFFVVLLYNILGLLIDLIAPVFGYNSAGETFLSEYIAFGTGDYHFTIAMSIIGVLLTLGIQLVTMDGNKFLGKQISDAKWNTPFFKFFNFIYEYVPFWGKDIITIEKGSMNPVLYYVAWVFIKAFDILISLFVGLLDIIGVGAKVISLAFRLFGNMMSGTALLTVMVVGLSSTTNNWFGFDFPVVGPIILMAQGLLVACIQAFVFPLLIAIFVKVARMGQEEDEAVPAAA